MAHLIKNPITGRMIKVGGTTHKKLIQQIGGDNYGDTPELLAGIYVALKDRIRSAYTNSIMYSKERRGPATKVVNNYEVLANKIAEMYNNSLEDKKYNVVYDKAYLEKLYNKLDILVPGWRNHLSDLKELAPLLRAHEDTIARKVSTKVGSWGNTLVPR